MYNFKKLVLLIVVIIITTKLLVTMRYSGWHEPSVGVMTRNEHMSTSQTSQYGYIINMYVNFYVMPASLNHHMFRPSDSDNCYFTELCYSKNTCTLTYTVEYVILIA